MKKTKLPFSLRMLQGAIGKRFVIKHYRYGIIKTRYPDMGGIVASAGQRKCRDLFKEAVAYAKRVMKDPELVMQWQRKTGRTRRLFNAIIKDYMLMEQRAKTQQMVIANRIIGNSFKCLAYADEKIWPARSLANAQGLREILRE